MLVFIIFFFFVLTMLANTILLFNDNYNYQSSFRSLLTNLFIEKKKNLFQYMEMFELSTNILCKCILFFNSQSKVI